MATARKKISLEELIQRAAADANLTVMNCSDHRSATICSKIRFGSGAHIMRRSKKRSMRPLDTMSYACNKASNTNNIG